MDLPRLTPKQYRVRIALILGGLVAILLGLPPYHSIQTPGGGGTLVYPDPRTALCFFGIAGVASGIAAIFAKSKPLILIGLAAMAMVAGTCIGGLIGQTKYPFAHMKGDSEELTMQRHEQAVIISWCSMLGAAAVPVTAIAAAAIRRRPREPAV
jgi:hypothetical protein